MTRFSLLMAFCVSAGAWSATLALADEPPPKLTAEEFKELEAKWNELAAAGSRAYQAGKYPDAIRPYEEGLKAARRLYDTTNFPDGHNNLAGSLYALANLYLVQGRLSDAEPLLADALGMYRRLLHGRDHIAVAVSLNNLAFLYQVQGRLGEAEPLLKDSVEMTKRMHKGQDHPDLARNLNNLARLFQQQGRLADAEPLLKDALAMNKRLFQGQDHLAIIFSLNNLAVLYQHQRRLEDSEPLFKDSLEMSKRLFKNQDHSVLATSLNNLAGQYRDQGKLVAAEPLLKEAIEMYKRLFKGQDHLDLAGSVHGLARLYQLQGKSVAAEPLFKDALEMYKRLFKGRDHPDLAHTLNGLAAIYLTQDKPSDAELLLKDALGMYRRLAISFAENKTEGETLTLLAQQPLTRDAYISAVRGYNSDPEIAYIQLWAEKGYVPRAYERRLLQARAATDPAAVRALAGLNDARRRRAELVLAPATTDDGTLAKRKADVALYEGRIEARTRELKGLLPVVARADRLDAAVPADLQKALPADAAVIDLIRFVHFAHDKDKPKSGETRTPRYMAFVLTQRKVSWVDLGTAAAIEPAVDAWRIALTAGKADEREVAGKVRELVWAKVRKELPAGITTVYVCPDAALSRMPFAALPGDKPGTVVLEEFAVATIPHAPFLLDKLSENDERKNPPASALVVGAVKYDAGFAPPAPNPNAVASRGEPLVKSGQKLGWAFLPNTASEANGIVAAADRKKIPAVRLDGEKATTAAVTALLPKARYAHFATHGFFADPSFRNPFQLDEKDFEMRGGERVGKAVLSPLVMTGLVFAGANDPSLPGRGIVTGEQLIDLDLSGLELAVLSACETGLGDVAGGQGTFGLQRAFHYAGATNVVCSLWKVPDESTAALMGLFYQNLWDQNLSPAEALRRAQLAVYRNPGKVSEWASGFRGKFDEVPGAGAAAVKSDAGGKTHPLFWAAFTLSGPGR